MTEPVLATLFAAVLALPFAHVITQYYRLRSDYRYALAAAAYTAAVVNEVLFAVYGRQIYFPHVLIDGVLVSLAILALSFPEPRRFTYPRSFFIPHTFF